LQVGAAQSALTSPVVRLWFGPRTACHGHSGRTATQPLPDLGPTWAGCTSKRKDPAMTRCWPTAALFATPMLLLIGARPVVASTQATITIIMTTLGTDGTPVTNTATLPPGSSVSVSSSLGTCDGPMPPPPTTPTNPPSGGGAGGASGGSGNPGVDNTPTPAPVSTPGNSTTGGVPATPPVTTGEPPVPPPPVAIPPIVPTDPGTGGTPTIPGDGSSGPPGVPTTPTDSGGGKPPTESPEPATLTLAVLGAIGAAGWAKRKKKAV
jgi:hypothetical protein